MRAVYLIGIGQTAVSKHGGVRGRYLVADAIEQAIYHAGIDPADSGMLVVGNMMSGILAQQQQLGALCADVAGLRGIEAATVEAACGSGAAAARWRYMALYMHTYAGSLTEERDGNELLMPLTRAAGLTRVGRYRCC
jgi:acetyl-CoA C-acetyltransferase